jgi:hypothetical protein
MRTVYRFIKIINDSIRGLYNKFEFRELEKIFNKKLEAVKIVKCVNCVSRLI